MRLLASFLVALALFFSPIVMANEGGMAAAHGSEAVMTGMAGHCAGDQPDHDSSPSKMRMDCMSACAAVPAVAPIIAARTPAPRAPMGAAPPTRLNGIPQESATPPPRFS